MKHVRNHNPFANEPRASSPRQIKKPAVSLHQSNNRKSPKYQKKIEVSERKHKLEPSDESSHSDDDKVNAAASKY